jgi:chaperonin GroES
MIIVKLLEEKKSEGGIIIPEGVKRVPQVYGQVLSTGPDVPDSIKEGDVIVFHQQGGQAIVMNKQIWAVVKYDEVYGVLEEYEDVEAKDKEGFASVSIEVPKEDQSRIVKP